MAKVSPSFILVSVSLLQCVNLLGFLIQSDWMWVQSARKSTTFFPRTNPPHDTLSLPTQMSEYHCLTQLFPGVRKMRDVEIKLYIDPNVLPVVQSERRTPFYLRNKVTNELKRLEENDKIEDATDLHHRWAQLLQPPNQKILTKFVYVSTYGFQIRQSVENVTLHLRLTTSSTHLMTQRSLANSICDLDITNLSLQQNHDESRPLPPKRTQKTTSD